MAAKKKTRKASEAVEPIIQAGRALDVSDLAEYLIDEIGGAREFAKLYVQEMTGRGGGGTKAGSVARAKMLEGVMRIVTTASAQNNDRSTPENEMPDADLVAVARKILSREPASESAEAPSSAPQGQARGSADG